MSRRWVDLLPLLLAVALVARLGALFVVRVPYPYDLEWMEGGMMVHAWRIQHHLPIYTAPSADWIPFIYPPGYAALLAAAGSLFGLTPAVGRCISLVGAFAAASALVYAVRERPTLALCGAAVFLGVYPETGAFFDLVRTESLFVGLLAWSIVFAFRGGRLSAEASGLLLVAAFLVKHNAAVFGVPLVVGLWARDGVPAAVRFGLAAVLPAVAVTALLQWRTQGYFLTYLLSVPAAHGFADGRHWPGTPFELGGALPVAALAAAVAVVAFSPWSYRAKALAIAFGAVFAVFTHESGGTLGLGRVKGVASVGIWGSSAAMAALAIGAVGLLVWRTPEARRLGLLIGGVVITAVGLAALMRAHVGGFINVHMSMFWVISLVFTLAMAHWRSKGAYMGPALVLSAQLAWAHAHLDVEKLSPTPADTAAGDAIVAKLRELPEPLLSPFAPWLAVQAGHSPSWHLIALWDITNHKKTPFPRAKKQIEGAFAAHHWAAVIDASDSMDYRLRENYRSDAKLPGDFNAFRPRSGWRARPQAIYTPREAAPTPR